MCVGVFKAGGGCQSRAEASGAARPHRAPDWAFILQSSNSRRDVAHCLDAGPEIINQLMTYQGKTRCSLSMSWERKPRFCLCCKFSVDLFVSEIPLFWDDLTNIFSKNSSVCWELCLQTVFEKSLEPRIDEKRRMWWFYTKSIKKLWGSMKSSFLWQKSKLLFRKQFIFYS